MTSPRDKQSETSVLPSTTQSSLEVVRELLLRSEASVDALLRTASGEWTADAQHLLEELEAAVRWQRVQSLSHSIQEDTREGFFLDTTRRVWVRYSDLIGEITTIFGMRGAGKSNTVALITEKLLQRGVPLSVIDPHGEYYSLRTLSCPLLVVGITGGAAAQPDLVVDPVAVATIAEFSVQHGVSIILDLSGLKKAVRYEVLSYYFEALWTACAREKRTYHIILEEAHAYIPQQGSSPVDDIVSDLSTEYRKFGVGMVVSDQRPANVKKTPITQARVRILHEVDHPLDVERYQELVPKRYSRRMDELLASFLPGTALVKIHKQIDVIQVQTRETVHIGVTPTLDGATTTLAIARDEALVQRLQAVLEGTPPIARQSPSGEGRKLQELHNRLQEATAHLESLTHENAILREQITLLSALRVAPFETGPEPRPDVSTLSVETLPGVLTLAEATVEHVHLKSFTPADTEMGKSPVNGGEGADRQQQFASLSAQLAAQNTELSDQVSLIETLRADLARITAAKEEVTQVAAHFQIDLEQAQVYRREQAEEIRRLRKPLERLAPSAHPPVPKPMPSAQRGLSADRLPPEQRIKWRLLINHLNALTRTQREIVGVLVAYEGTSFSAEQIGAKLQRAPGTIRKNVPDGLIHFGLITRTKRGNQPTVYTSVVKTFLRTEFAGYEEALLTALMGAL